MDKHHDMLRFLISNAPLSQKYALLRNVTEQQANILSEIAVNVLYGVLPISRYYKRKLQPFKKIWHMLVHSSNSVRKKLIGKHSEGVLLLIKAVRKTLKKLIEHGIPENDTNSSRKV